MQEILEKEELDLIEREEIQLSYDLTGIDLRDTVPKTDIDTIRYLSGGKWLAGIFQLESDTNKNPAMFLKKIYGHIILKMKLHEITEELHINRLSDVIALIRPGCIEAGMPERYGKRLYGEKCEDTISKYSAFYPIYSFCTNSTQFELIYQEQLMELFHQLFDISYGKADIMRRYFEKHDEKGIELVKKQLWLTWKDKAAIEDFKQLWDYLCLAAGYAFNLSHSISYAKNAYYTAFIKVKKLVMYCAALIHRTDLKSTSKYLSEAYRSGSNIKLSEYNNCYLETYPDVESDTIFLNLSLFKGVKAKTVRLLGSRNDFESIDLFLTFCSNNKVDKGDIKKLISTGYFDKAFINEFGDEIKDKNKIKCFITNYINEFVIKSAEQRQMKEIKKYKRFIYKPLKNEELISENPETQTAWVYVLNKPWDLEPYQYKYSNNDIENLFNVKTAIGIPLINLVDMYDIELEEDEDVILVDNIEHKTVAKSGWKFTNLYDVYENKYFFGKEHLQIIKNSVLKVSYKETDRGYTLLDYKLVDILA